MEKTKKVVGGCELEILLITRTLIPVIAGAIICLVQMFGSSITVGAMPVLQHVLLAGKILSPTIVFILFLVWLLFISKIWRTLFPQKKAFWILFIFSFVPVIGPFFILPVALLFPAKKRTGNATRWNLLLIFLILLFELQITACFFPIFGTNLLTLPQILNLLLSTIFLILAVGFPAYRQLAGRRLSHGAMVTCGILVLILIGEYIYSAAKLKSTENKYAAACEVLEQLRVPLENQRMRDFYQNGSPFDEKRTNELTQLIEDSIREKTASPALIARLDSFAESQVPVKDPHAYLAPLMREPRMGRMQWDKMFDVYHARIRDARKSGKTDDILTLYQQEWNLLMTFFDEPETAAFDTLNTVLVQRARLAEFLVSAENGEKEIPVYVLSALESMYKTDEERLRYAFRRLCYRNTWYLETLADKMARGGESSLPWLKYLPDVKSSRYALGAPMFSLILYDRTRMLRLSGDILKMNPWEREWFDINGKLEPMRKKPEDVYLFSSLETGRIRAFDAVVLKCFTTISEIRRARVYLASVIFRNAHDGRLPYSSMELSTPIFDTFTGRAFPIQKTQKNGFQVIQKK